MDRDLLAGDLRVTAPGATAAAGRVARRRRTAVALSGAVLLLCAITVWFHAEVLRHRGRGVFRQVGSHLERSDQLLHAWALDWNYHTLPRDPLNLFRANAFHPHPYSLALSDHLFGVAVTLAPLRAFVSDPVELNTLGTLATFVLAGTAIAALVWYLTGSVAGACVAGMLYAFNPFRQSNYAQIQLLADYAIPLSFLFLHRYERSGRSRDLVAMAVSVAWQVLCSTYLGAYLAVILGGALLGRLWRKPHPARNWPGLLLAAVAGVVMLAPFLYPYVWLRAHGQLHQHEFSTIALSLGVKDLACWRECGSATGLRLAPFAAALAGAAVWPPARAPAGAYAAVAAIGALLALGPYVHLTSIADLDAPPGFLFPGPYWLLQRYGPGFDGLRVPGRFIVFGHFGLSVLAGLGAARIVAASPGRIVRGLATAGVLAAGLLTLARPQVTFEPMPAAGAAVHRWLAESPSSEPIVELPLGPYDDFSMYNSRFHRRPLVNGYSGFIPFSHRHVVATVACYPCPAALRALADLNVRTHLIHLDRMSATRRQEVERLVADTPALTMVRRFDDTLVVSLADVPAEVGSPSSPLVPLDRDGWHVTSSRGPRGVDLATDASLGTAWSTGIELDDLRYPIAGLRLLRRVGSWREFLGLIPRGWEWLAIDLGSIHAVRRLSLAFSDLAGGPPALPAPTVQGSRDGVEWFDLPSDAVMRPSLWDLDRTPAETRLEYDWPATEVRHLRLTYRGFWYLRDVAVFE